MDKKKEAARKEAARLATIAEIFICDEAERIAATEGTRFEFVPVRYGRNKQHFKAALIEKGVK